MITPYPGGSADTSTQSGTQRQDVVPPLCLPGWTLVFASPAPALISGCRGTIEDDARMLTSAAELKPDILYGRCHLVPLQFGRTSRISPFRLSGENSEKILSAQLR